MIGRLALAGLAGAVLCAGSAFVVLGRDACLGRCGAGTQCDAGRCLPLVAPDLGDDEGPGETAKKRKRRRSAGTTEPRERAAAPEATLKPGDEKMVARGDALGRPQKLDFGSADDAPDLDQADLDRVWKGAEAGILRCIAESRGDLPIDHGRVNVGLRVEPSGGVDKVRVEGPAVMQAHGLHGCVRRVVTALRFPRSGGTTVVTYPFELR